MTFTQFEKILKTKYPCAIAVAHGKLVETELNKKVSLSFTENGKVYSYYGTYEDILCKIGINVVSKSRYQTAVNTLSELEKAHGKEDDFFGFVIDNSADIAKYRELIKQYQSNFIIV